MILSTNDPLANALNQLFACCVLHGFTLQSCCVRVSGGGRHCPSRAQRFPVRCVPSLSNVSFLLWGCAEVSYTWLSAVLRQVADSVGEISCTSHLWRPELWVSRLSCAGRPCSMPSGRGCSKGQRAESCGTNAVSSAWWPNPLRRRRRAAL